MRHLELSGLLSAVPADDFAGGEWSVCAVHVAAELALVPVLVGSLGELALDPTAQGVSHSFLLLSVRSGRRFASDRVPLLTLRAQEASQGPRSRESSEKK